MLSILTLQQHFMGNICTQNKHHAPVQNMYMTNTWRTDMGQATKLWLLTRKKCPLFLSSCHSKMLCYIIIPPEPANRECSMQYSQVWRHFNEGIESLHTNRISTDRDTRSILSHYLHGYFDIHRSVSVNGSGRRDAAVLLPGFANNW